MNFKKIAALAGAMAMLATPALADWAAIGAGQKANGAIVFFTAKSQGRTGPSFAVMEECRGAGLRNCKVIAGFMDPECVNAVASREKKVFTGPTIVEALRKCQGSGNSCNAASPSAEVCAGEDE